MAIAAAVARAVGVGRPAGPGSPRRSCRSWLVFAAAHVALLLPRCGRPDAAFDRYVLPLIPCAAIPLLLAYQARRPRPGVVAWGLLVVWAAYAVGTTQELLATGRAREARRRPAGRGRRAEDGVTGGFDFDLWTQLQAAGHVNSVPPDRTRPARTARAWA